MAKKPTIGAAPWQDLEQQAYHAYREWPIWLMLRERELSARLNKPTPPSRANRLKQRTAKAAPHKGEDEKEQDHG